MNNDEDFQFPDENEESPCEHCELKFQRVHELLHELIEINQRGHVTVDEIASIFEDFYDLAYDDGETNAYENIGVFALDLAHNRHEED